MPNLFSGAVLQAELFQKLAASTQLAAILGPDRVFDKVPDRLKPPYINFGQSTHRQWDTSTEPGEEHSLELEIWSKNNGRKHVFEVAEAVRSALEQVSYNMPDHALVNLEFNQLTVRGEPKLDLYVGVLNLRAVTEVKL